MNPEPQNESVLETTVKNLLSRPEQESYNPGVWRGDGVEHVLTRNEQKKLDRVRAKHAKQLDVAAAREEAMQAKELREYHKLMHALNSSKQESDELDVILDEAVQEVNDEQNNEDQST